MSYDDDKLGRLWPTREGEATGRANERQMLDAIGGASSFRTRMQTNGDGSVTMLRTRGGRPEFTTTRPDKVITVEPEMVVGCIGVPVSYTYQSGYANGNRFDPMVTPITEEQPGSALAVVESAQTTFKYNQYYSTKFEDSDFKEHPGNRWWRWKAKGKTISWWSPCPLTGIAGSSQLNPQILGGTKQPRIDAGWNYAGKYAAWSHNRTAIYIDGEKVYSFPVFRWIYAAAAKEVVVLGVSQTVVMALVSASDQYGEYRIPDGPLMLMAYNIDTQVLTFSVATSAYTSRSSTTTIANFAFNESATKVAYEAHKYSDQSLATEAHIFEMDTATGAETVVRRRETQAPEIKDQRATVVTPSSGSVAWTSWFGVGSHNYSVSVSLVRGFYYVGDRLAFATIESTRTGVLVAGAQVEVKYGFDDSAYGGSRHEGTAFYSMSGTANGKYHNGLMNGASYSMTNSTHAKLDSLVIGGGTLSHASQASGEAGSEVTVPVTGGVNFDQPVSGSGSYTASASGLFVDFAAVTADGDAVVVTMAGGLDYTETATYNRPAFVANGTLTITSSGSSSGEFPVSAYVKFANGARVDLPSTGSGYLGWASTSTIGVGEYVFRGGIASDFAQSAGMLSLVALEANANYEYTVPVWSLTWAFNGGPPYAIVPPWPGSFAYFEAPIFFADNS